MSQFALMKERRFYPLFWTQFLGAFNDNFLKNALVILITFKAKAIMGVASTEMVAIAGGIFVLPFFLFSATAGQLADKYEKGRIVRVIKLAEIAIMCLASVGLLIEHYELLLAVLFLMGLHSTFFGPIKFSILPQHLRPEELVGGNALIEAGTFLSILLGTIAGGVLISLGGKGPWIVSLGLVSISLAGYLASRAIPTAPAADPTIRVQWNPIPPTLSIWRSMRKDRVVVLAALGISWFWFFGAALLSLFPAYCKDTLGSNESLVTLFLAIFSVGIGIGSMFCERFSRKRLELGLVPFGSIGISLFAFDLFLCGAPSFVTTAAAGSVTFLDFIRQPAGLRILMDLLLLSVFSGFYIVPLATLLQERSDPVARSRVIAGNNVMNAFFMVLSAVAIVVMTQLGLTIPQMFLVIASINAVVAIYIYTLLPEFLFRFLSWIIANLMYRLRVVGGEHIPDQGAALLVCNHVTFVDWMIVSAAVGRPVRFVMDHTFFRGWIIRRLMTRAGVIPIATARENPEILENAFREIAAGLRAGDLVCIFPEGRLTSDGKLGPFKPGLLRIVAETPVPVIPLALGGLWGSVFSRKDGAAMKKVPRRFWSRVEFQAAPALAPGSVRLDALEAQVGSMLKPRMTT